ncbi:hypothetical protein B0T18DRAFT_329407, partial [Schizothecium vesticola]
MFRPTALLAVLASLVSTTWANCDCVGLDYTEGGSYLIDGYSDGLFSFTSVFEGACFDASIVPILISPEGYGYLCSQIHSAEDGIEQVSTCEVSYADMNDGSWAIVIQSQENDFVVQREFDLTAGGSATAVIITTEYAEPEIVTDDCYLEDETVFHYIPGPTSIFVNTVSRSLTLGTSTQYYQSTVTKWAYCRWP